MGQNRNLPVGIIFGILIPVGLLTIALILVVWHLTLIVRRMRAHSRMQNA